MIVAGIPAYNEEKTIAKVILQAQKYADVVVVCDDGSQDMTSEIAQKLGAVVIKHSENMGYGYALQSLFKKANELNADVLLTLDADGQHDAREIPMLTQPILENKADIVIGSRFLEGGKDIPSYRRFGIKILTKFTSNPGRKLTSRMVRRLLSSRRQNPADRFELNISDAQCGFRAYDRRALESITMYENGMGASAEILMKAEDEGLRVVEVPVQVHYQDLDTSTHNAFRHGLSVLSTIIKLIVEDHPLLYLGLPGLVLLLIGGFFGLWTLQTYAYNIEHGINIVPQTLALATVAFGLTGIFAIFTSVTLFAIARLSEKTARR